MVKALGFSQGFFVTLYMASLNALASIIQNTVNAGYGIASERIAFSQIKDEIVLTRSRIIAELKSNKKPFDESSMFQWLRKIEVKEKDIKEVCDSERVRRVCKDLVYIASLPPIMETDSFQSIRYLGSTNQTHNLKTVMSRAVEFALYDRVTGKEPFAWVNDNRLIIFNYKMPLKEVAIEAVFQDPRDLYEYDCCDTKNDDHEFACSGQLQDMITGKLIESYVRVYLGRNPAQPNTQVDKN